MKNTDRLVPESYYHVYNRGINGENLFKKEENYSFFLARYSKYVDPIADTYAYCLLKNHFHLLIRTKTEEEILDHFTRPDRVQNPVRSGRPKTAAQVISLQFSHFFNSYTQAINKQHSRTGKLFELPFRRILVDNDYYFSKLVHYIHLNPQQHGLIDDFREYPHSSYASHLSSKKTKLKREQVFEWFGNRQALINFHQAPLDARGLTPVLFGD